MLIALPGGSCLTSGGFSASLTAVMNLAELPVTKRATWPLVPSSTFGSAPSASLARVPGARAACPTMPPARCRTLSRGGASGLAPLTTAPQESPTGGASHSQRTRVLTRGQLAERPAASSGLKRPLSRGTTSGATSSPRPAAKAKAALASLAVLKSSQVDLEEQAKEEIAPAGRHRRSTANEDEASSEESSVGDSAPLSAAATAAQRKSRRRLMLHLAEAVTLAGAKSSLLETKSVSEATLKNYRESLGRFKEFASRCSLPLNGDANVDAALVLYFTAEYFRGGHPSRGERTLAGLMMLEPEFSVMGRRRVPRAWRALRGWKRLTPVVTRKPLPWPFWAGMATTLGLENPGMACFTLMCVSGYFRPSELLSMRRCDLVPPAAGVLTVWSILLFPEEVGRASKTQQFNDSVEMDDERILFLEPVWRAMSKQTDLSAAWSFTYHEYLEAFKKAAAKLRMPCVCPYQMRHSGPSIDLADKRRSLDEAQRRGRWAQPRSMMRYERRARLAAEWAKVPEATRKTCETAAARLEAVILGLFRGSSGASTRGFAGST